MRVPLSSMEPVLTTALRFSWFMSSPEYVLREPDAQQRTADAAQCGAHAACERPSLFMFYRQLHHDPRLQTEQQIGRGCAQVVRQGHRAHVRHDDEEANHFSHEEEQELPPAGRWDRREFHKSQVATAVIAAPMKK